ncbi:hypothetical protein GGI07_000439 [Coemansia sp. Benny D115]|nr:hypothetical protein GGI07_000439 [Coemansia sp. Benny D115]
MKVLDADSRPEADAENNVNQDIENDVFPFNDNLGPNDAIAMIKAVECAVSKETKLKHTLYCQWEGVRTDAQKLLDSVKVSVGNSR